MAMKKFPPFPTFIQKRNMQMSEAVNHSVNQFTKKQQFIQASDKSDDFLKAICWPQMSER